MSQLSQTGTGVLEDSWRAVGVLKKLVLTSVKECRTNRIDGLASKSEGKQASTVFFFHILLCALPPESVTQN